MTNEERASSIRFHLKEIQAEAAELRRQGFSVTLRREEMSDVIPTIDRMYVPLGLNPDPHLSVVRNITETL